MRRTKSALKAAEARGVRLGMLQRFVIVIRRALEIPSLR
jgi:hypothetical protein